MPRKPFPTGHSVKLGWADHCYTGEVAAKAARDYGIDLQIVKLARFRSLMRDYE